MHSFALLTHSVVPSYLFLIYIAFLRYYVVSFTFFFFNDTATTEIYTLSLHDALPISAPQPPRSRRERRPRWWRRRPPPRARTSRPRQDRKSTRLNSSHANISYAVFCLKKKKITTTISEEHTSEIQSRHSD